MRVMALIGSQVVAAIAMGVDSALMQLDSFSFVFVGEFESEFIGYCLDARENFQSYWSSTITGGVEQCKAHCSNIADCNSFSYSGADSDYSFWCELCGPLSLTSGDRPGTLTSAWTLSYGSENAGPPTKGDGSADVVCSLKAAPLVASAVGDPHLSNIGGDHFDVYKPGNLVLLQLPRRAEPASTFLLVEADARRKGDPCSVYFQFVTISGTWTNQSEPIRFSADPNGKPSGTTWKQWMHFGTVDMKVTYHEKGVGYLNIYVKNLGHTGYEVGGLLGSDDHTDVAVRPRQCPRHRGALLMSSVAGAS